MDIRDIALIVSIVGHCVVGVLVIQMALNQLGVTRRCAEAEAYNKRLVDQVEELKGMVAGADFAQLAATRLMQDAENRAVLATAEADRAKKLR